MSASFPISSTGTSRSDGDLITPEAVNLRFSGAGIGSRALATFIDLAIKGVALAAVASAAAALDATGAIQMSWIAVTLLTITAFLILVGYDAIWGALSNGTTPGKRAVGLRIVTLEGGQVKFRHTSIRAALWLIEVLATLGAIAMIAVYFNGKRQRLGDMVAGTRVVRERFAESLPVATQFSPPPGGVEFARNLDVSMLRTEDYQLIRSFLVRAPGLRRSSRTAVAEAVARRILGRLHAQVPSDIPAEAFLLCVAAAYQRRFS